MVNLYNSYKVQEGLSQETVSSTSLMILTSPKEAIKKIITEKRKVFSISIFLIASFSIALSFFLLISSACPIKPSLLIFGCLLELPKIIFGFFIASAFIHVTAGFLSANGSPKPLFWFLPHPCPILLPLVTHHFKPWNNSSFRNFHLPIISCLVKLSGLSCCPGGLSGIIVSGDIYPRSSLSYLLHYRTPYALRGSWVYISLDGHLSPPWLKYQSPYEYQKGYRRDRRIERCINHG